MNRQALLSAVRATLFVITSSVCLGAYGQQLFAALPNAPDTLLLEVSLTVAPPGSYSSSAVDTWLQSSQNQAPTQSVTGGVEPDDAAQTHRILGVIPNFRSVSANQHLPPQSSKEKFITATEDSFDYSSVLTPALLAGYDQARNKTPEFRQGAIGYGRYFWHSFADQTSENYWVEFIVPAIAHEDTRYYTLGHGGFIKRAGYAVKHVAITRNDAGKDVFNAGEVVGAALGAGLSNAYYPSAERSFSNTAGQWGTSIGIDAVSFALREFWPDINHALFHGKK